MGEAGELMASRNDPGTEATDSATGDLPDEPRAHRLDVIFGILQNERRRRVLRYLREQEATTQGELAEHLAAIENDVSLESVTSTQRKRVYVSLYQSHLPKLDEAGAIAYDSDRGTVERVPGTDEFLTHLDNADRPTRNPEVSRAQYTLAGAALLGVAMVVPLFLGSETGFGPIFALSALAVGSACVLILRGYRV